MQQLAYHTIAERFDLVYSITQLDTGDGDTIVLHQCGLERKPESCLYT